MATKKDITSNEEELQDVAAAETYSHSDDDDEEYDDDEEDEEEEQPFWKQHLPAILMALVATVVAHVWNISSSSSSPQWQYLSNSEIKHAYLESFERTANISFCINDDRSPNNNLNAMDFYIPQDYVSTLVKYYQADTAKDDLYQIQEYPKDLPQHQDVQCLQQQRENSKRKFKGTAYYYKTPTLEEIYPELAVPTQASMSRQRKLQQPPLDFTGFATKFVNLSPNPLLLQWEGKASASQLVGEIPPFESLGTATMPGHSFFVTPVHDTSTVLQRWVVTADTALVYYETDLSATTLKQEHYDMYQRQLINQAFARDYLIGSGKTWLGHFPPRSPMHYMHPASHIGQQHQVGDFSLEVISVAPRAFLIDNFLSPQECQSIIEMSQQQGLQLSTLHTGATAKQTQDLSTRSSSNTWLPRDTNNLTESIYQKAARVMNLDAELFQKFHESSAHHHSIAESLQVVRYKDTGEEYQPHHDFVYPSINHRYQPTRFATLLIYLNDVENGGETRFPRALNNWNSKGLEVKPKIGQAVLFYNMLEDGNVDDLSQHGSNPTIEGHEKWLANMWIWNPIIG